MTEIERKAKRLERGKYKMGYMKQFCSNEFKCSYEMPVVLPLSGDCQEATIPEVTEAKITIKNIVSGQLFFWQQVSPGWCPASRRQALADGTAQPSVALTQLRGRPICPQELAAGGSP